jgi:hypothetical protein
MQPSAFNFYFRWSRREGFEWHIGWVWVAIVAALIWWAL